MKEKRTVVPKDFLTAVKDIKLAILQARARAAQMSNVEALKLYFFVGGYISKKTRNAKWGSGAINALSDRLQVELPGLRGFSPQHIRFMRQFYEEWSPVLGVTGKDVSGICYLPSSESKDEIRYLTSSKSGQVSIEGIAAFLSVGFTHHRSIFGKCKSLDERWYYIFACAKEHWPVTDLERHIAADDYRRIGKLPNNFEKALPIAQATKAVRSFRDEYLLELVNLDNVDAVHDQDIDERILSKGLVANIEVLTNEGRIDMTCETATGIWLIEFKLDRPAEEALAQIDERNYAAKYDFAGKTVRKLGISFSSEQRTIVDVRQG